MLTETSSKLFTQLVDVNWEIKQHQENKQGEPNYYEVLFSLQDNYLKIRKDLIAEMGQANYDKFIGMGRKMFAPKQS